MKRGTPNHPKLLELQSELEISKPHAVGVLESLWHFVAEYAPTGGIQKFTSRTIARSIGWDGDPDELIEGLINTRWLDRLDDQRIVVHDWAQHADDGVHNRLARSIEYFWDGTQPKLTRLGGKERADIEARYANRERETAGPLFDPDAESPQSHGVHTAHARHTHGVHTAEAEPELSRASASAEAELEQPVDVSDNGVPLVSGDHDSGSDSGESAAQVASGSASLGRNSHAPDGPRTREQGCVNWLTKVIPLFAPKASSQFHSDQTSAKNLFDERIWPPDAPLEQGNANLETALKLIEQAARRDKPMAWLTTRVQKELGQ